MLCCVEAYSQVKNQPSDSLQLYLAEYNQEKDEIERFIRLGECDDERLAAKKAFQAELKLLDSLLVSTPLSQMQAACKNNKFLIVAKWKESSKCLKIRYEHIKYLKGCEVPFITDSVNWGEYTVLNKAIADKRVCIEDYQFSNYTQVDKLPEAGLNQESADNLLNQIKRILKVYTQKIGVTFDEYEAYEKSKDLKTVDDAILFRTRFLNMCMKKLN